LGAGQPHSGFAGRSPWPRGCNSLQDGGASWRGEPSCYRVVVVRVVPKPIPQAASLQDLEAMLEDAQLSRDNMALFNKFLVTNQVLKKSVRLWPCVNELTEAFGLEETSTEHVRATFLRPRNACRHSPMAANASGGFEGKLAVCGACQNQVFRVVAPRWRRFGVPRSRIWAPSARLRGRRAQPCCLEGTPALQTLQFRLARRGSERRTQHCLFRGSQASVSSNSR
jgi:hypothetical protein